MNWPYGLLIVEQAFRLGGMLFTVYILRMKRLRCFVAMRFDESQTDTVYDKLILPALRKQEIVPIRIDRVEHNDNIDARIIEEIERCDLAIADLTFARPSVYFEAGYAAGRPVPVIYTCRKDHFTPRSEDACGNLRVHFDLQMKNIIPWNNERDRRFLKKLMARIKKVVLPIALKKARFARENESRLQFVRLSMAKRLFNIRKIFQDQLKSAGFRRCNCEGCHYNYHWLRKTARGYALVSDWVGESFSKSDLRRVCYSIIDDLDKITEQFCRSNRPVVHWIVCTLSRTPRSRVQGAVEHFAQDQSHPYVYVLQTEAMWMVRGPMKFSLHTIDSIQSEDDFSGRLKAILTAL